MFLMEKNVESLNSYLKTLEIDTDKPKINYSNSNTLDHRNFTQNTDFDIKGKKNSTDNISGLSRDLLLNNNNNVNVYVANPQRFFMEKPDTDISDVNQKINDYNFVPKKNFKENLDFYKKK